MSYPLGDTEKFMEYLAVENPSEFIKLHSIKTIGKSHAFENYRYKEIKKLTQLEKNEINKKYEKDLEHAEKDAKILIEKTSPSVNNGYFTQRLAISFDTSLRKISKLRIREVSPIKENDYDFPYKIKYFNTYNPYATPETKCNYTRGYFKEKGDVYCIDELRVHIGTWEIPEDLAYKIDEDKFKLYVNAFFSIEKSSVSPLIDSNNGGPWSGSGHYFYAACEQLDVYESKDYSNLIMTTSCNDLNRHYY